MTNQASEEALKKCIYFCDFCIKAWKRNECGFLQVEKAIAVCAICGSFLCEAHSLYESDAEIRRCRDCSACRTASPEQDEGGGD